MFQGAKVLFVIISLFFLVVLMFIYAYLPLTIDVGISELGRVGRNNFFYTVLGTYFLVYVITHFFKKYVDSRGVTEYVRFMIHLLPIVIIFSMTLLIGFIGVNNNADDIVPSTYYYLNYLSAILLIGWFFGFLFTSIKKI